MVAVKPFTQTTKFRVSSVSAIQQSGWSAQTSGQIPAKSESAGNIIWIAQSATSAGISFRSAPVATDKDARRQAWRDLWAMLERAHQHPERYEHMTDEWLSELRGGWDDRLADIYGADYWD